MCVAAADKPKRTIYRARDRERRIARLCALQHTQHWPCVSAGGPDEMCPVDMLHILALYH